MTARHWYYTEVDQYFGKFEAQSAHINKRLGEIEHLTDDDKTTVNLKLTNSIDFFGKVRADKEGKQLYQEPAFGIDGIVAHLNLLSAETEAIFNKPPPKKEEPKPEAKPEDKPAEEGAKPEEKPAEEGAKAEEKPDAEM